MNAGKHEYDEAAQPATNRPADASHSVPPAYSSESQDTTSKPPPVYTASAYMRSLQDGDPQEKISVPMIHTEQKHGIGDYLPFGSAGKTKRRTIIMREMTRDTYLKHYAKDDAGNYIGTEKMFPDAGLMLVPSKSTEDDVLQQLQKLVDEKHAVRDLHSRKRLR